MSKTSFADPLDDFDEDFLNWMSEILNEINEKDTSFFDDEFYFFGDK